MKEPKPLPPCPVDGCPRKARSAGPGSRCAKHGGSARGSIAQNIIAAADTCVANKCGKPKLPGSSLCGHHAGNPRPVRRCIVDGCVMARYRARMCLRHLRENQDRLGTCGHPLCGNQALAMTYCQLHDVGIDYAAGDWHDWVAVERLWAGRQGERMPTVPELREVLRRAEAQHVSYVELAHRMGIEESRMHSWRQQLARLDAAVAA